MSHRAARVSARTGERIWRGLGTGVTAMVVLVLGPVLVLAAAGGQTGGAKPRPSPTATVGPTPSPAESPGVGAVGGRVNVGAVTTSLAAVPGAGGKPAEARVTVVNQAARAIAKIEVTLRSASPAVVVKPGRAHVISRLDPQASATASWSLCTRLAGTYTFDAIATVEGVTASTQPLVISLAAAKKC